MIIYFLIILEGAISEEVSGVHVLALLTPWQRETV